VFKSSILASATGTASLWVYAERVQSVLAVVVFVFTAFSAIVAGIKTAHEIYRWWVRRKPTRIDMQLQDKRHDEPTPPQDRLAAGAGVRRRARAGDDVGAFLVRAPPWRDADDATRAMKLVLQYPHPLACQHACYAMLTGQTLERIIADVGNDNRMDVTDRERIVKRYGLKLDVWSGSFIVGYFPIDPTKSLATLMKQHRTLLCSVNDYRDASFGHAIVIHNGDLYDPHAGMNPTWPWSRVISHVQPVEGIE
jgi:hypothetical protein